MLRKINLTRGRANCPLRRIRTDLRGGDMGRQNYFSTIDGIIGLLGRLKAARSTIAKATPPGKGTAFFRLSLINQTLLRDSASQLTTRGTKAISA